jgi:hypothetical protein
MGGEGRRYLPPNSSPIKTTNSSKEKNEDISSACVVRGTSTLTVLLGAQVMLLRCVIMSPIYFHGVSQS